MLEYDAGFILFIFVQVLISYFIYAETEKHGSQLLAIGEISIFAFGISAAVAISTYSHIFVTELLLILLYLVVTTALERRASSN